MRTDEILLFTVWAQMFFFQSQEDRLLQFHRWDWNNTNKPEMSFHCEGNKAIRGQAGSLWARGRASAGVMKSWRSAHIEPWAPGKQQDGFHEEGQVKARDSLTLHWPLPAALRPAVNSSQHMRRGMLSYGGLWGPKGRVRMWMNKMRSRVEVCMQPELKGSVKLIFKNKYYPLYLDGFMSSEFVFFNELCCWNVWDRRVPAT